MPCQIVLMKWNTAVVEDITKDAEGTVVAVTARYAPGGNFKKSAKLTWVCDSVRVPHPLHQFLGRCAGCSPKLLESCVVVACSLTW